MRTRSAVDLQKHTHLSITFCWANYLTMSILPKQLEGTHPSKIPLFFHYTKRVAIHARETQIPYAG